MEMEIKLCSICYMNDKDNKFITCNNTKCNTYCCKDCFHQYLNYNENNIPKCISEKCTQLYLCRNVYNKISKEHLQIYNKNCYEYISNKNKKIIENELSFKQVINQIKKERKEFIDKQYKTISFIIQNVYSKKFNQIKSNNKKIQQQNENKKHCMISYCKGFLDNDYKCLLCETVFCKECEQINKDNHECKKVDLETISFINNMIKCPNCLLPVEKSSGCNDMTCASCKTNFCYRTGEIISTGGHSTFIEINDEKLLSESFFSLNENSSNIDKIKYNLVKTFETQKPKVYNLNEDKRLLKLLINVELSEKKIDFYKSISILISDYITANYKYKIYIKKIKEIEENYKNNTLTLYKLKQIINDDLCSL